MLSRLFTVAFIASAVASFLFVACSGSDSSDPTPSPSPILIPPGTPSPAELAYFDKLSTAMSRISPRFDELDDTRNATFDDQLIESSQTHRVRQYADQYLDLAADARDFIGPINAPLSLASLHAALVEAVQNLVRLGTNLALDMELNPALSEEDLADAFSNLNGATAEQRVRETCSDLQFYAAGKGVAADIICPR